MLGACVGEDPIIAASPDGGASNPSEAGGGTDGESPSEAAFTFDPPAIDLAPGETMTLKIRGATTLAAITLSVTADALPDGGAPPPNAVTLGTSSVSLAASGEATVQVQASPSATQQHFRIKGASGALTRDVPGRIAGKPGELDIYFGEKGGYFDLAPDGDCTANSVLVESDGRFVVAGTSKGFTALWIARFTPEGELDTTFGPTKAGFVSLSGARGPQMERMPDGSIAISALAYNDPKLYRIASDGIPDAAWGGANGMDPQLGGPNFVSGPIGKQGDNVLVGGATPDNTTASIKRYLPNGTLDPELRERGQRELHGRRRADRSRPSRRGCMRSRSRAPARSGWLGSTRRRRARRSSGRSCGGSRRRSPVNVAVTATFLGAATALTLQDGQGHRRRVRVPGRQLLRVRVSRVERARRPRSARRTRLVAAGPPAAFPTSMVTDADAASTSRTVRTRSPRSMSIA